MIHVEGAVENKKKNKDGVGDEKKTDRHVHSNFGLGCSSPRCRYACSVAMRPRGVRERNPILRRKGSCTSSSVSTSSWVAAAMVVSPTGPPLNFLMMVSRMWR